MVVHDGDKNFFGFFNKIHDDRLVDAAQFHQRQHRCHIETGNTTAGRDAQLPLYAVKNVEGDDFFLAARSMVDIRTARAA